MKKYLATIIIGLTISIFPLVSYAQEVPATTAQVEELKATLITLLQQLIAQLQAQINDLLAQQAIQGQTITTQQTQINSFQAPQVQTSQTPTLGAVIQPVVATFGPETCIPHIQIPVSASGDWTSINVDYIVPVAQNNEPQATTTQANQVVGIDHPYFAVSNWDYTYNLVGKIYKGKDVVGDINQTLTATKCN